MLHRSCANRLLIWVGFIVQALRADAEESRNQVEVNLMRVKAAKTMLAFEQSTILTRLNRATQSLESIAVQHGHSAITSPQVLQHSTARYKVVKSTPKQSIFDGTSAPIRPRPLSTYAHTASLSAKDILPCLLRSGKHGIASVPDRSSGDMSFADVSLVRGAIACHRMQVLTALDAKPTETAWYVQHSPEVRPGLHLSTSSTLGSSACLLAATLGWFSTRYKAACLVFLEDNLRAAQAISVSGWHDPLDMRTENSCSLGTDEKLPGASYSAAGSCEQRGAKVLEVPLHVPTPQLQLLRRYGLMSGENQRVPILEAVRYVLRGMLLRYHKQLPLSAWQQICMQFMQKIQRAVAKVSTASACSEVCQHEHGEWPDECPWAHVQEVAGEMMKLCLVTIHEAYCQSFNEGGLLSDSSEFSESLLSLGQVVERLQEESCCMAIVSSVLLTDAPATYRMLVANDQDLLIRSPMVRSCIRWLCLYCVSLTSVSQYHHRYRIHVFAVPCSESFPKQHPPKINRWEGKVRQRSLQR